jgi:acyl-coenzyme A synthetase/AMP-(fatty) acid ligase/rubrerythrin
MRCPTCERLIDVDLEGASMCCAGAHAQWRCVQCGTLSTGFAFPYGRCPRCDGMLEMLAARPVDASSPLEAIRVAFEIELGGRAFYQRAAAETRDTDLRLLFGRLALMEGEHMETLSRRYHLDVPVSAPELRVEVAAIFAGVAHRPEDPANLLRIAVGLEQRAAQFFATRAAQVAEGSPERRLYTELAAEEQEHAELLAHELARWDTAAPGRLGAAQAAGAGPRAAATNAAAVLIGAHEARRTALACGGATLDYFTLRRRVARAAGLWRDRGVGPGDRVAVKLPDGFDWVTACLGAMWAGAVAVPVNPRVPEPEWHYILDEAGFSAIVAQSFDDTPPPWRERGLQVEDFRRGVEAADPLEACPMDPRAPAFWCHSSGTSGKPKAVVHAHRFAQRIEQVSREGLGIGPQDRLYASSKLFFAYPQTNALWAGLKLGATVVLDPQWPTAAGVAATVAAQRPTVLLSVPSLYRNLLHEGLAPAIAGAGVRLCVSAGEALPPSLRDEWLRQTGLGLVNGYGASETLVLVMLDRGDGRGFRPSPGIEVRALEDLPPGVPTRLRIRAPTLALGYLDRPQAQAEAFRDGDFCPADLFAPEAHGGWRFAGREDSLVKIHGRWVNLVELEERLASKAPGVREAAAVCVPDEDGVDAVAFFYAADDAAAGCAALQERAGALPPHQRPRWWHAVPALPRGPTGKLLRRRLRELHRTLA